MNIYSWQFWLGQAILSAVLSFIFTAVSYRNNEPMVKDVNAMIGFFLIIEIVVIGVVLLSQSIK